MLVLVLVLVALIGCGHVRQDTRASVKQRAAFDMSCSQTELTLTPLTEETLQGANSYGVEGCGKRAVYVRTTTSSGDVWVLNTPHMQPPAQDSSKP